MSLLDWLFSFPKKKKVFISFAIEDKKFRNYLVSQAKKENSPFDFIDMSVKKPWRQSEWKQKCRAKIKRCDGVIVLLSNNTYHADGVRWEMKCANQEKIKLIGMHIKKYDKRAIPTELRDKRIIVWSWENLRREINRF